MLLVAAVVADDYSLHRHWGRTQDAEAAAEVAVVVVVIAGVHSTEGEHYDNDLLRAANHIQNSFAKSGFEAA